MEYVNVFLMESHPPELSGTPEDGSVDWEWRTEANIQGTETSDVPTCFLGYPEVFLHLTSAYIFLSMSSTPVLKTKNKKTDS